MVSAIKANRFVRYHYFGSSPNAELYDSPELTWLLTGIPILFVNAVGGLDSRSIAG
jgi:hypothetical protein